MRQRLTSLFCIAILLAACGPEALEANRSSDQMNIEQAYATWAAAQPRPPEPIVDRIESLLASQPCIGRLDHWSRTYAFDYETRTRAVVEHIIAFHLEEAGPSGARLGRQVTEPESWVNLDDRPIRMVEGDFDVSDSQLRIGYCGNNVGASSASADQLRNYLTGRDRRRAAH
jgi:hypothetical protein